MADLSKNPQAFSRILLQWNREKNFRQMPWKNEKDPYKIWISEIILQQTRVQQGLEYYKRFIDEYPSVKHIADAGESQVFKLWEGLGYYSRCKNIIGRKRADHIAYKIVFIPWSEERTGSYNKSIRIAV